LSPNKPPSSTDKRLSPHPAPRVNVAASGPLSAGGGDAHDPSRASIRVPGDVAQPESVSYAVASSDDRRRRATAPGRLPYPTARGTILFRCRTGRAGLVPRREGLVGPPVTGGQQTSPGRGDDDLAEGEFRDGPSCVPSSRRPGHAPQSRSLLPAPGADWSRGGLPGISATNSALIRGALRRPPSKPGGLPGIPRWAFGCSKTPCFRPWHHPHSLEEGKKSS
jgi:hypothetical protein